MTPTCSKVGSTSFIFLSWGIIHPRSSGLGRGRAPNLGICRRALGVLKKISRFEALNFMVTWKQWVQNSSKTVNLFMKKSLLRRLPPGPGIIYQAPLCCGQQAVHKSSFICRRCWQELILGGRTSSSSRCRQSDVLGSLLLVINQMIDHWFTTN